MSEFSPFGSSAGEDVWNMFAPGTKTFAREDVQPNGAVVEGRVPHGTYFSSTRGDHRLAAPLPSPSATTTRATCSWALKHAALLPVRCTTRTATP